MSGARRGGAISGPSRKENNRRAVWKAVLAEILKPDQAEGWTMEGFAGRTFYLPVVGVGDQVTEEEIRTPSLRTFSRNHWRPAQIRDEYRQALFGTPGTEPDSFPEETWLTLPDAWARWCVEWLPDHLQQPGDHNAKFITNALMLTLQALAYRPLAIVREMERRKRAQRVYEFNDQFHQILDTKGDVAADVARQLRLDGASITSNWLAYAEGFDTGPWTDPRWPEAEATLEDHDEDRSMWRHRRFRNERRTMALPRHWYWRARGAASVGDVDRMADAITHGRAELGLSDMVDGLPAWRALYATDDDWVDDLTDLCREVALASWRLGVNPDSCRETVRLMLPDDLDDRVVRSGNLELFWWQAWATGHADRVAAETWPTLPDDGPKQRWEKNPQALVLQYWAQTHKTRPDVAVAEILRPAAKQLLSSRSTFLHPAGLRAALVEIEDRTRGPKARPYDWAEALPVLARLQTAIYLGEEVPSDVAATIKRIASDIKTPEGSTTILW